MLKIMILLSLMVSSVAFGYTKNAINESRRTQYYETCKDAYKKALAKNLLLHGMVATINESIEVRKRAKERCSALVQVYDNLDAWSTATDTGEGCEMGVRAAMKDYPKLGDSHNLRDWKVNYGMTCLM
jgi:hypothetical protein